MKCMISKSHILLTLPKNLIIKTRLISYFYQVLKIAIYENSNSFIVINWINNFQSLIIIHLLSVCMLLRTICTSSLERSRLFLFKKSSNLPESIAEKNSIAFWYNDNKLLMLSIVQSSLIISS